MPKKPSASRRARLARRRARMETKPEVNSLIAIGLDDETLSVLNGLVTQANVVQAQVDMIVTAYARAKGLKPVAAQLQLQYGRIVVEVPTNGQSADSPDADLRDSVPADAGDSLPDDAPEHVVEPAALPATSGARTHLRSRARSRVASSK